MLEVLGVVVDLTVGLECVHEEAVLVLCVAGTKVGNLVLEVEVLLVHVENGDPAVVEGEEVGIGDTLNAILVGVIGLLFALFVDVISNHTGTHVVVGTTDVVDVQVHGGVLKIRPVFFAIDRE